MPFRYPSIGVFIKAGILNNYFYFYGMKEENKAPMEHPDALNQVADFHRTFQHPIESAPTIPAPERCHLRVNLLEEEVKELKQAIADNDLTEIADALCDIQYVLSGAILEFGLAGKFQSLVR